MNTRFDNETYLDQRASGVRDDAPEWDEKFCTCEAEDLDSEHFCDYCYEMRRYEHV